jgi:hypothetical protein
MVWWDSGVVRKPSRPGKRSDLPFARNKLQTVGDPTKKQRQIDRGVLRVVPTPFFATIYLWSRLKLYVPFQE